MIVNAAAARLALLVVYAMDTYLADRAAAAPTLDPRAAAEWELVGHLLATDAVYFAGQPLQGGGRVFYGYVLRSRATPSVCAAAVRGTNGILEWIEDAEFLSVAHPVVGRVEQGFWGIYAGMEFVPVGGAAVPAAQGVAKAVEAGSLIVLGHSLGAALATYLAFDCAALLPGRTSLYAFASPHPGDATFGAACVARLADSTVFNYELDLVPRVPLGPDYDDLPTAHWIGPDYNTEARIRFDFSCNHHLLCYCAQLDYALMSWEGVDCVKGPVVSPAPVSPLSPPPATTPPP